MSLSNARRCQLDHVLHNLSHAIQCRSLVIFQGTSSSASWSSTRVKYKSRALDKSSERRYCIHCNYNLQGIQTNRCPECGAGFDPGLPNSYKSHPTILPSVARCVYGASFLVLLYILLYLRLPNSGSALAVIFSGPLALISLGGLSNVASGSFLVILSSAMFLYFAWRPTRATLFIALSGIVGWTLMGTCVMVGVSV